MNRLLVYLAITTIILLCVWKIGYDRSATSSNVEQVALDESSAGPLLPASMRSMLDNPVDAGDGSGSFGQRITNVTFPTDPTDPNSVFISTSETLNSTFRTDIDQWLPTKIENRIYTYNEKTQQLERLYATTTDGHTSFGIKNIAARKAILARDGVRLVIYSNYGHGGPCIDAWLADDLSFLDLSDLNSGLHKYALDPAQRAKHQAQQDVCFATMDFTAEPSVQDSPYIYQTNIYSFSCLSGSTVDTGCTLVARDNFGTIVGKFGHIEYDSFDPSILPSPSGEYLLLVREKAIAIIDTKSLNLTVLALAPRGQSYGTHSGFPSFIPHVNWDSNTAIRALLFQDGTLEDSQLNPHPVPISELTLPIK